MCAQKNCAFIFIRPLKSDQVTMLVCTFIPSKAVFMNQPVFPPTFVLQIPNFSQSLHIVMSSFERTIIDKIPDKMLCCAYWIQL